MRLTIKAFRLLRKAAKGVASGHHHLLEKVDENFCFAPTQSFHHYNIFFCKEKELRRPEALSPMTLYQANASIHGPT